MGNLSQMVAVSAKKEPVNITDKYHKGVSAALVVEGIEVILTAKDSYCLNVTAKKLMGSRCFNLDFAITENTVIFGVSA